MSDRQQREDALRRRMRELAGQFLTRTRTDVARLTAMMEQIQADAPTLQSVIMLAHKICGTASTFQFDDISSCAGELERAAMALSGASMGCEEVRQLVTLTTRLCIAADRTRQASETAADR